RLLFHQNLGYTPINLLQPANPFHITFFCIKKRKPYNCACFFLKIVEPIRSLLALGARTIMIRMAFISRTHCGLIKVLASKQ
ncbi:MAG: hypothetical protein L0I28_12255, partial [Enterobacterales bacterium]|nr:hypothetical protein [Enterobacterales bacterium]